ncbi:MULTISPECIES: ATP-binding protein [unclassified Clostridium]|uniref:ATP-binding protein n=1 Tax=unclassified Clostridium TaxID=2614128 RepID=UPI00029840DB|nr:MULTISPECIES: ATP-binding protein [unclassified Clostridium]EKQ54373.1 MAG: transcriptional activator of acetoin/glycerol metabolism [Clostridium sp. Maddingley MBC34-26]
MESWERCKKLGLESDKIISKFLSDEELEQKLQENSQLIKISKFYMDFLSMNLTDTPHMVALSDNEGWIIDFRGTPEELGGREAGRCLGASWAEENIGNNGIGTALVIGQPVLVYGVEHYVMAFRGCACIGVPIKRNGNIIGVINITVPVQYDHPERVHILIACANSIEFAVKSINNDNNPTNISSEINLSVTSELIATAVHDLKNPLSVIRGLGQLGNLTSDKSKINNYFTRIIKQVDEMNYMVMELLSIFKPEELIYQKVIPIIEDVLYSFEPICDSKNIKLSLINDADEYVNMSERLLKRAIQNLINNAVQVMDNGGMIEVRTKLDKNFILILIRDTAGGIPEELNETLFEPFSFRRNGGTGLGLFMAYHTITNIHKGKIWFETELDRGTTFFIKLPITQEFENSSIQQYKFV